MGNDSSDETHFPRIVAWLALAAAVALFLRNTVPALRERFEAELKAIADGSGRLKLLEKNWKTAREAFDAAAEKLCPQAVDDGAGSQGVVGAGEPGGKISPVAGIVGA